MQQPYLQSVEVCLSVTSKEFNDVILLTILYLNALARGQKCRLETTIMISVIISATKSEGVYNREFYAPICSLSETGSIVRPLRSADHGAVVATL